jgi:hypothetical protein
VAGLDRALPFERKAFARIHQLSRGVPRRINLLCDRALLGAFAGSRATVDRKTVDKAAVEVFGPRPASASPHRRTAAIDALRAAEFARLDAQGEIYLDYTGGGLYAAAQVRAHAEQLLTRVYGNPHSSNPTSLRASELVERCRVHVLRYFNAPPDDYAVIFVNNASQALKLVGESYPFDERSTFLLTFDNHNSVNGIREFARARGAQTVYVPVVPPDMRADGGAVIERLDSLASPGANLFAYPAQSNFSGVQHPLEWVARAQEKVGRAPVRAGLADVVLYWPRSAAEITPTLAELRGGIEANGGIWVFTAKRGQRSASGMDYLNQTDVIGLGLAAGLVDNKICSVSDTESAMRFVIRKKDRRV